MAKKKKSLIDKSPLQSPQRQRNTIPLEKKSSFLTPNPGLQRMMINRLANMNAIPGIEQGRGIPPSSNPAPTPGTTSEIELITQTGFVLTTQAGDDLITQQGN